MLEIPRTMYHTHSEEKLHNLEYSKKIISLNKSQTPVQKWLISGAN